MLQQYDPSRTRTAAKFTILVPPGIDKLYINSGEAPVISSVVQTLRPYAASAVVLSDTHGDGTPAIAALPTLRDLFPGAARPPAAAVGAVGSGLGGAVGGESGSGSGAQGTGLSTGLNVQANGSSLSATLPLGDDRHSTVMRRLLQALQDGGDGVVPLLTASTVRAIRRYGLYSMPGSAAYMSSPGRPAPDVAARMHKQWTSIGGWYADSTRLPVLKLEATLAQPGGDQLSGGMDAGSASTGSPAPAQPPPTPATSSLSAGQPIPQPRPHPQMLHTQGPARVSFDESAASQSPASAQIAALTAAAAAAAAASASTPAMMASHGRYHVAVLGGSFSPITDGHLQIAAEVVAARAADEVWIVPCGPRPDKPSLNVDALHRYAMTSLAVEAAFPADFPVRVMPLETWEPVALPS